MLIDRRVALSIGGAAAAGLIVGAAAPGNAREDGTDRTRETLGLIGIEEHCLPDEVRPDWERVWQAGTYGAVSKPLADIHGGRIADMDRYGVQMMVLSLAAGGPQSEGDPARAQDMAKRGNDALAGIISRRPDRFAAFGCLAMHDVDAACREFERVVRILGMRGVLINNMQQSGPDRDSVLFYDAPQYDAFWATAERLGAPVYLHPNYGTPARERDIVEAAPWLRTAAWNYAVQTGTHALRIITNGVFDRHPGAQMILGHNGEHIVSDIWRIDNRIRINPGRTRAAKSVRSYFKSNVFITTSGEFSTPALQHCIAEIGADRIMFSVDTPFEETSAGAPWFRSAEIPDDEFRSIGRNNASRLLKLSLG